MSDKSKRVYKLRVRATAVSAGARHRTARRWRQQVKIRNKKLLESNTAHLCSDESSKESSLDNNDTAMQSDQQENLPDTNDGLGAASFAEESWYTQGLDFDGPQCSPSDIPSARIQHDYDHIEETDDSSSENWTDSDDDRDDNNDGCKPSNESFADQPNGYFNTDTLQGRRIMFPAAQLTVSDVLLMCTAYSVRKELTREDQNDLINFVKVLAGPEFESWEASHYMRSKAFDPPGDKVALHYYCETCCKPLCERKLSEKCVNFDIKCTLCQEVHDLSPISRNCFMVVDVKYQIQLLLNEPTIQENLLKNLEDLKNKERSGAMSDISDSSLYSNIQTELPLSLTYNINTDGAPLNKSSNRSFWPLQLYINELSPKERFRHIILAGLWLTDKEPKPSFMNLYMSAFGNQAIGLMEEGVDVLNAKTGLPMNFKFSCHAISVDSVARPILQNRLQFNGYFGCSWCYIRGEHDGSCMRYPMTAEDLELRSHETHLQDAVNAAELGRPVRGVKGFSDIPRLLRTFDFVWGFPHDYMHGILLGVKRQLWNIWTTPGTHFYLTRFDRDLIDKRLLSIKPPHEIHRLPRSSKDVAKRKASEWRSLLLFWSAACLDGILDRECYDSYLLLVQSIFTLLSTNITEADLRRCEHDLCQFVGECEILYGTRAMTFNMHAVLHLVESVRRSGPLWATSAFPFENGIFYFKQKINSPNGVSQQIALKWLKQSLIKLFIAKAPNAPKAVAYCESLFGRKLLKYSTQTTDGVRLIGTGIKNEIVEKMMHRNVGDGSVLVYNRCIYKESVFHSTGYNRPKRTDDTVVLLASKKIMRIHHIVAMNNKCYVIGRTILTAANSFGSGRHVPHILEVTNNHHQKIAATITSIEAKVIYIDTGEKTFVSFFPNTVEIQ